MSVHLAAAIALACTWLALVWHTIRKVRSTRTAIRGKTDIAVIYASQTGTASDMAQRTAEALGTQRATLLPIDQVSPRHLLDYKAALFIASTYGEGDPPDMAQAFYAQMLASTPGAPGLAHLEVGVLALGDSSYSHYCGFGRLLSQWLAQQGARFLFDTVQADQCAPDALLDWQTHLTSHFAAHVNTDVRYAEWRLVRRCHMNPGSMGGACYELALQPVDARSLDWSAGDIAEIQIADTGVRREYSIASTPGEKELLLLVRQHAHAGGRIGLGSQWLTQAIEPGATLRLHIRRNTLFRVPIHACPAIFIGNGTGIAGLRSLLQARVEQAQYENWLVFGERQQTHDFHYGNQFRAWQAGKNLQRLDLAFSRDQPQKHYVHHLLRDAAAALKDWVARGAVIYVCGSKNTMALDVDHALQDILGPQGYAELATQGRYRRDVY